MQDTITPQSEHISGKWRYGNARLTEDDVRRIIQALADGYTCAEISRAYGMSQTAIRQIKFGHSWKHISRNVLPQDDGPGPEWLTSLEIRDKWGIYSSTLTKWSQSGRITRKKHAGKWLYHERDVSEAYWSSPVSRPSDDDFRDEVEFKRSFGKSWETVVNELSVGLGVGARSICIRINETVPGVWLDSDRFATR